jgi:hypothetical protein
MQPEGASTREDADCARATHSHNSQPAERGYARVLPDVSRADAMRRKRSTPHTASRALPSPAELEILREAVRSYVLLHEAEGAHAGAIGSRSA